MEKEQAQTTCKCPDVDCVRHGRCDECQQHHEQAGTLTKCRRVVLVQANLEDAEQLHDLQIRSFKPLLDKYQDYNTNPGAEQIDRMVRRLKMPNSDYFFIEVAGERIGGLRIARLDNNGCRLKQIYIVPEHQGHRYAQQAIALAEALYPQAEHWALDTIKQEVKLCHLYEKLGYRQTGEEEEIQEGMTLVMYRK